MEQANEGETARAEWKEKLAEMRSKMSQDELAQYEKSKKETADKKEEQETEKKEDENEEIVLSDMDSDIMEIEEFDAPTDKGNERRNGTKDQPRRREGSPSTRRPPRRRERSRERRRSRDRSSRNTSRRSSAYDAAYEKWKRFKQAERVMLSAVNRKKDIYDKRPEDHPKYSEEWKEFWESRYKDLQKEGKDTEKHDYKAEWIPHWGKRITVIFEEEVKIKTEDLLRQHGLETTAEPRESDFKRDEEEVRRSTSRERSNRRRSSPHERRRRTRSRSPYMEDRHRSYRDRSSNGHDLFSVISDLEHERDYGRHYRHGGSSRSPPSRRRGPPPPAPHRHYYEGDHHHVSRSRSRSPASRYGVEDCDGPVLILPSLRLLTALESVLGSLGPQINSIMGRALNLEQTRIGASNVLLMDPDVACILDMVKEKLSAQMVAGLLEEQKQGAVRVALGHLTRLLRAATKKRPEKPPALVAPPDEKAKIKAMISEQIAKILVKRGQGNISDYDLRMLIFRVVEGTQLEGSVAKPQPVFNQANSYNRSNTFGRMTDAYGNSFQGSVQPKPSSSSSVLSNMDLSAILAASMAKPPVSKDQQQPPPQQQQQQQQQPPKQQQQSDDKDDDLDEFDELTTDELKSLLDNQNNLSQSERNDLMQYMKKLESKDPEKVKQLRGKERASLNLSGPPPPPPPQQPEPSQGIWQQPKPQSVWPHQQQQQSNLSWTHQRQQQQSNWQQQQHQQNFNGNFNDPRLQQHHQQNFGQNPNSWQKY